MKRPEIRLYKPIHMNMCGLLYTSAAYCKLASKLYNFIFLPTFLTSAEHIIFLDQNTLKIAITDSCPLNSESSPHFFLCANKSRKNSAWRESSKQIKKGSFFFSHPAALMGYFHTLNGTDRSETRIYSPFPQTPANASRNKKENERKPK